ncbi:hypothetical protein [Nocardioides acrostichi]|uniref:Uncharacterized protein n=1 Tax=Nocardioides acrostichi TaxID=2784339 RepID=A0A930Y866_9ACTN|nr:hypothetical protein [Nocardioides acrostichi]MBF4162787.1 hypothetical protein [Nocardioides acrostichi]
MDLVRIGYLATFGIVVLAALSLGVRRLAGLARGDAAEQRWMDESHQLDRSDRFAIVRAVMRGRAAPERLVCSAVIFSEATQAQLERRLHDRGARWSRGLGVALLVLFAVPQLVQAVTDPAQRTHALVVVAVQAGLVALLVVSGLRQRRTLERVQASRDANEQLCRAARAAD